MEKRVKKTSGASVSAKRDPSTALVLAGGGARGAYEAGVAYYICRELRPGRKPIAPFNIFAGTSIGALNSSFLAARADDPARAAEMLAEYWQSLTMSKVLGFGMRELAQLPSLLLGKVRTVAPAPPSGSRQAPHPPIKGILDTSWLFAEMSRIIPWDTLKQNLHNGSLRSLALCATEVCTGRSVIFYQSGRGAEFAHSTDPSRLPISVEIGVEHAMASSAIPLLFPSVQIDGVCYVDGAIHQNTPLYPAIRLGAEKILVVSLLSKPGLSSLNARPNCGRNSNPSIYFLLGRMLNALMTEALDYELERMEMFNNLIRSGDVLYGRTFLDNMNAITKTHRNADYRLIEAFLIRPSRNLNDLAREALAEAPHELEMSGVAGKLFEKLLTSSSFSDSELLSYLMFTPTYTNKLLDLGRRDARARKDELIEFFAEKK